MPPTKRTTAPPDFLEELHEFSKLAAQVPYNQLMQHYLDAGWLWALRETDIVPCADATVCVTFELVVGRAIADLKRLDQLTVRVAPGPGPVSAAARVMAGQSVLFLLSGRLPPPQQPQTTSVPTPNGAAIDMQDRDVALPGEDGGEYVREDRPLALIEKHEPDGVPIFKDLYALGDNTDRILDALLVEVEAFASKADSSEQLKALYTKNADAMQFLKDFGDVRDKSALKSVLDQANERLAARPAPAAAVPRRRAPREARH